MDGEDDGVERRLRERLRAAGRAVERASRAYRAGRAEGYDLPTDRDGNARIVCRRHAEQRAVPVDRDGRPDCFDAGHPACEGCVEDVRRGAVETW